MKKSDVVQMIRGFTAQDRGSFLPATNQKMFDTPLVGFCSADDPIFDTFLRDEVVGDHHLKPKEILTDAQTVISYFLPISERVCRGNRSGPAPPDEWVFVRFYGELLNERLRRMVKNRLQAAGFTAQAPSLSPSFAATEVSSNWSERHAAYACGLGTFGLHAGLITSEGVAGRFGSIITSLKLPAAPRHYQKRSEHCRYYTDESCAECLSRCPVGALSKTGKDKQACRNHLRKEGTASTEKLGFPYQPCGKCYVNVPCERSQPN